MSGVDILRILRNLGKFVCIKGFSKVWRGSECENATAGNDNLLREGIASLI